MDFNAKNFSAARRPLLDALRGRAEMKDRVFVRCVLNGLGATWFFESKYHEGIEFLTGNIRHYSDNAQAYSQRATMLWYLDQVEGGLRDAPRDLASRLCDFLALSSCGQMFRELGELH